MWWKGDNQRYMKFHTNLWKAYAVFTRNTYTLSIF